LWSHIRYLGGDFRGAKERYERVLQFQELPSDQTHSIYIRLASVYLKEENVRFFVQINQLFSNISNTLKISSTRIQRNCSFFHAEQAHHACPGSVLEFAVIE
jgi:hypothetical protein